MVNDLIMATIWYRITARNEHLDAHDATCIVDAVLAGWLLPGLNRCARGGGGSSEAGHAAIAESARGASSSLRPSQREKMNDAPSGIQ